MYQCRHKENNRPLSRVDPISNPSGREIHLDLVREAKKGIESGSLQKVVASRRFSVPMTGDILSAAVTMIGAYPDAFSYLIHHPGAGTWMGATPEVLLKSRGGMGQTIALAGTRSGDPSEKPHRWTDKERHEQQVVTDYIVERISGQGLRAEASPVKDIRAGSLWHLGTVIRTEVPPDRAGELLKSLHPTPAVCGLPKAQALSFIREHENYDREYYTGYLGEVGLETPDGFEFYVNLRCLQVRNGLAYLYVGGGITAESEAVSEWEETQQKSTTMLSLVDNS
jgi:isochorismate synthase